MHLIRAQLRATDALVVATAAEPALRVHTICEAAEDVQTVLLALGLPIVLGVAGLLARRQGAQGGRAIHLGVGALAAKAAAEMLAVGFAADHAVLAGDIIEIGSRWLVRELASCLRRHGVQVVGAVHCAVVGILPAEAAVDVPAIGIASEHAGHAARVPVVRHCRRIVELAPQVGGAEDLPVGALATEAALGVDAVGEASHLHAVLRAVRVPKIRDVRLGREAALAAGLCTRAAAAGNKAIREMLLIATMALAGCGQAEPHRETKTSTDGL
eukprot:CAMPEP_0177185490 /NCGR_PEP_ID=MMETSP0367-20130122/18131_1 /TAXON_ID=447022 ORGANISM="Scrippsiella hangoei-like, Strain SHHI-4" /NCGR_SAMPLE_ID=MMETSP0367 /ASSEMBLY_ACC=CAM_ASM_000362 /LENGTH=270 /DNA_ID=CAMNT_0018632701 /DNA_START=370 /DNA_END=1180 /DNA_ORIENTATION=+